MDVFRCQTCSPRSKTQHLHICDTIVITYRSAAYRPSDLTRVSEVVSACTTHHTCAGARISQLRLLGINTMLPNRRCPNRHRTYGVPAGRPTCAGGLIERVDQLLQRLICTPFPKAPGDPPALGDLVEGVEELLLLRLKQRLAVGVLGLRTGGPLVSPPWSGVVVCTQRHTVYGAHHLLRLKQQLAVGVLGLRRVNKTRHGIAWRDESQWLRTQHAAIHHAARTPLIAITAAAAPLKHRTSEMGASLLKEPTYTLQTSGLLNTCVAHSSGGHSDVCSAPESPAAACTKQRAGQE